MLCRKFENAVYNLDAHTMEFEYPEANGPQKLGMEYLLRRKVVTMENMKARYLANRAHCVSLLRRCN